MYWTLVFLSYRQHFIIAINQGLGYYAILCHVEVQTNGLMEQTVSTSGQIY